MTFVSITRLRIRDDEFVEPFFMDAVASNEQASAAPGNLGVEVLGEASNTYWTKSVWVDRAAMRAFMTSGVHARVMPRLREWCDEAHVAHWEQESDELPSWPEAHRRLVAEGRASAVEHPTPAHRSRDIPAPQLPS
jgi:heme-degrading monooxygenase HmoA